MITIKTSNDSLANDILNQYICTERTREGISIQNCDIFEAGQILRFNAIKFNVI